MILIEKNYSIDSVNLPASWSLSSTQACATAEELTGTTSDGNISLTLRLQDETCFANAQYTLTVVDSCGRVETLKFYASNPCSGWNVSVVNDNMFNFEAVITGGTGVYNYDWAYNTDIFELSPLDDSDNGYLSLKLKTGEPLALSEVITLTVSDSNGCTKQIQHVYPVCKPRAASMTLAMTCGKFSGPIPFTTGIINRATPVAAANFVPCTGRTINWATLEFSNIPANVFVVKVLPLGSFIVYANTDYTSTTSPLIKARVKDDLGVWSDYMNIGVSIPQCTAKSLPVTMDGNYVFKPSEATVGGVYYRDISNFVATDETLDWSTFTFVAGTGQTLVSATSLTTANASVTLGVDRKLKYTVASIPTDTRADTVKWRVSTASGLKSKEGRMYFDYSVATAPVAVADSTCVVCGNSKTIQPLSNDTGNIDPTSFNVTVAPTKGNYTFNNPDLTFVANTQTSGTDTLTYKVANPDGNYSNAVNITYTIYCAGADNETTKCTGATVNFTSLLSTWASSGGTWTQDAGNPATVVLTTPSSVSFSGKPAGTYWYTYTVTSGGCTDLMRLKINLQSSSTNDNCGSAISMPWPSTAPGSSSTALGEILACDTDYALETVPGVDQNPSTWNTSRSGDVWYSFTTTSIVAGSVTVNGSAYGALGIRNPQIALYSGGCTIDTFTIVASASETNGNQNLTLTFPTLSVSTAYKIRISSGEYQGSASGGIGKFNLILTGVSA